MVELYSSLRSSITASYPSTLQNCHLLWRDESRLLSCTADTHKETVQAKVLMLQTLNGSKQGMFILYK